MSREVAMTEIVLLLIGTKSSVQNIIISIINGWRFPVVR